MSENDPQIVRQAIFELPDEHTSELVALIANFAIERGIGYTFELSAPGKKLDKTTEITPAPTSEKSKYNPELIAWVDDEVDNVEVAVVSEMHFQKFADTRDEGKIGRRRFSALTTGPYVSDEPPKKSYERQRWDKMRIAKYRKNNCLLYSRYGTLIGIRADKIQRLLELSKSVDGPKINEAGRVTIEFLSDFCDELLKTPDTN